MCWCSAFPPKFFFDLMQYFAFWTLACQLHPNISLNLGWCSWEVIAYLIPIGYLFDQFIMSSVHYLDVFIVWSHLNYLSIFFLKHAGELHAILLKIPKGSDYMPVPRLGLALYYIHVLIYSRNSLGTCF
jgi:hypothetical protein